MRRRIELGTPAVALAAVLVVWTWIAIVAAVDGALGLGLFTALALVLSTCGS